MGIVGKAAKQPEKRAAGKSAPVTEAAKPPSRPSQCRPYMRRVLMKEFPGIVDGFVKSAKRGSCLHVKLATELLEAKKGTSDTRKAGRRTLNRLVRHLEQIPD